MGEYAIVAIGYNRPDSMQRLLKALSMANYGADEVTLYISIDNSGNNLVEKVANDFLWIFGKKIIRTYPKRQGLRAHILQCGEIVKNYRAIAVFEDDVIPSPGFYNYMKASVEFYEDNSNIAGISLYNHLWNVNVDVPFQPSYSPYDTYFLQYAQSWGQVWMKKQWLEFADWYDKNTEEITAQENLPRTVTNWPKTSWLKYHIKYCVDNNKYFVYPYHSFSTCFSDVGEHCKEKDTRFQVAMEMSSREQYTFPQFNEGVKYDVFFERVFPNNCSIGKIPVSEVCIDLYGSKAKHDSVKYLLSKKNLPYKIVRSFGQDVKPHEENIFFEVEGNDIFLYDTTIDRKKINSGSSGAIRDFRYHYRLYGSTKMLLYCIIDKVKSRLIKRV